MPARMSRRQLLASGMAAAGAAVVGEAFDSTWRSADAQETKSGPKALAMAWGNDIKTMDPAMVTSSPDYNVTMQLFNGLVRYRPNSIDIEPDLALRWEVSTDGLAYTFYLRKGVKFHKGYGEMTADDVKFSFERVVNADLGSPYKQDMELIKNVEVVNPYTVLYVIKMEAYFGMRDVTRVLGTPGGEASTGSRFFRRHTGNGASW